MIKKLIVNLSILFFLFSCQKNKYTTIHGKLVYKKSDRAYLKKIKLNENNSETYIDVDSTAIHTNGSFTFKRLNLDSGIYEVHVGYSDPIYFIVEDYSPHITISIAEGPIDVRLTGSQSAEELTKELKLIQSQKENSIKILNKFYLFTDSINKIQKLSNKDEEKIIEKIQKEIDSLKEHIDEQIKQAIKETKAGPLTMLYSSYLLSNQDKNFPFLDSLSYILQKSPYQSEYIKNYLQYIDKLRPISIGGEIHDIVLRDTSNQEIKLSSLRGSYVLIDFWASWCQDCRKENPNLVNLYEKYKHKKFDILGISLDKEKKEWIKAIKKDKLKWKHVSELRGWDSPIVKEYQITNIPSNLLISPEGKIIAKNVSINELEKKLNELTNH